MSNDKYSYQLIFKILESNAQYFYRVIDKLKFCGFYLKEKKIGENFVLTCWVSRKKLQITFNVFLTLYLFIGLFWFLGNLYFLTFKGKLLNNTTLDLVIISTMLLAFPAGKARATIKLSKLIEIQFKED